MKHWAWILGWVLACPAWLPAVEEARTFGHPTHRIELMNALESGEASAHFSRAELLAAAQIKPQGELGWECFGEAQDLGSLRDLAAQAGHPESEALFAQAASIGPRNGPMLLWSLAGLAAGIAGAAYLNQGMSDMDRGYGGGTLLGLTVGGGAVLGGLTWSFLYRDERREADLKARVVAAQGAASFNAWLESELP